MKNKLSGVMVMMAAIIVVISIASPAAAAVNQQQNVNSGDIVAQQSNETTTATQSGEETCTATRAPELQQADLHTSDEVISKGDPGQMSGAIVLDATAECPVRVQVTLNVPNNMYIEGASDIGSGGGGLITNTFTVQPGEAKDIAAEVYGTEVGDHTVVADITYFPEGQKDMAREIDGMMMTFTVEEPAPHTDGNTTSGEGDLDESGSPFPATIHWLLGIVTLTVTGLLIIVGRRTNISIST